MTTKKIKIYENRIILEESVEITLGGIAKGYAIDQAIDVLKEHGIKSALVNAGGDMRAIGANENRPWRIALQDPRDKNNFITEINLSNDSIATSGDYERYFVEKSAHHIINPRTGESAHGLISVTILAKTAIEADSIATSVFVMGAKDGLFLIETLKNVEGLLITEEKEILKSAGFNY